MTQELHFTTEDVNTLCRINLLAHEQLKVIVLQRALADKDKELAALNGKKDADKVPATKEA
tara:strand:- start:144 stop:326 length:183 start_codon:yes stop_codon:yes gene_type:complete